LLFRRRRDLLFYALHVPLSVPQNKTQTSTFKDGLILFIAHRLLEGKFPMTQHQRQLLNVLFLALTGRQVDTALRLVPALVKDHRFRPRHIGRQVWESKGRFIAPQ